MEAKIPEQTQNLFNLLECQSNCWKYMISSIKKIWVNYQLVFDDRSDIETLKSFLRLDKEVKFIVVDSLRLRTPTKGFANDGLFIKYLLQLFSGKLWNPKLKLVRK